jgi:hypothetical protein
MVVPTGVIYVIPSSDLPNYVLQERCHIVSIRPVSAR